MADKAHTPSNDPKSTKSTEPRPASQGGVAPEVDMMTAHKDDIRRFEERAHGARAAGDAAAEDVTSAKTVPELIAAHKRAEAEYFALSDHIAANGATPELTFKYAVARDQALRLAIQLLAAAAGAAPGSSDDVLSREHIGKPGRSVLAVGHTWEMPVPWISAVLRYYQDRNVGDEMMQSAGLRAPFQSRRPTAPEGDDASSGQTDSSEGSNAMNAFTKSFNQSDVAQSGSAPRTGYVGPGWYVREDSSEPIVYVEFDRPGDDYPLKITPWRGNRSSWTSAPNLDAARHLPQDFVEAMLRLEELDIRPSSADNSFAFQAPYVHMQPAIRQGDTVEVARVTAFTGNGIYLVNRWDQKELFRVTATPAGLLFDWDCMGVQPIFYTPEQFAAEVVGRVIEPVDLRVKRYTDEYPLDRTYIWHDRQARLHLSFAGEFRSANGASSPHHRPQPVFIATFSSGQTTEILGNQLEDNLWGPADRPSEPVQALIDWHQGVCNSLKGARRTYHTSAPDGKVLSEKERSRLAAAIVQMEHDEMALAIDLALEAQTGIKTADAADDAGADAGDDGDPSAIYQYAALHHAHHVESLLDLPIDALNRLKRSYGPASVLEKDADGGESQDIQALIQAHEVAHAAFVSSDLESEDPAEKALDEAEWAAYNALINCRVTTIEDARIKAAYLLRKDQLDRADVGLMADILKSLL